MYGFLFRPKWLLFHLIVIAGVMTMVAAGFWQIDRLDQRRTENSQVIERSQLQPVPLSSMLADIDSGALSAEDAEWRPVSIAGTYLPDQVVEFNNSQGGRAGDFVLTAMITDEGDTVIVNRGFIPLGMDLPQAPAQRIEGVAYVRRSEVRDRGGLTDADDGSPLTETRRIDIPRLSQQFPGDVAPVYVQLILADPPIESGAPSPVPLPELSNGSHLSYAMQWFVFSVFVIIGWVLAVRRSLQSRATASAHE